MTSATATNLLDELATILRRFVAFPSGEALVAVVLWVAHTHAVEASESTPRLAVISPERGSGKTRLLEVLSLLVRDPLHAVNISPAALYRLVSERRPTLLLDEADTYLGLAVAKQHEELRGLINAGHRRGARVYRGEVSGGAVRVTEFQAYAACALAGIGDLPDTILDRSVIVAMKRRAPHEHVEPFRERQVRPDAERLRAQLATWGEANHDALRDLWPPMPDGISDRAADVWEPLIAIADQVGGHWPDRARSAAARLHAEKTQHDPSLGVQLLADCRRIFDDRDADRLTTETLVAALVGLDDGPWSDLRGKPLDARRLAQRLRGYGVRPGNHRFQEAVLRGYLREDFHDAWLRYVPVADVAHVAHHPEHGETTPSVAPMESELGYDHPPDKASLPSTGEPHQPPHAPQTTRAASPRAVGNKFSEDAVREGLTLDDALHEEALFGEFIAPYAELVDPEGGR
jgi:hypothetical protein